MQHALHKEQERTEPPSPRHLLIFGSTFAGWTSVEAIDPDTGLTEKSPPHASGLEPLLLGLRCGTRVLTAGLYWGAIR
jgi:hypothetical protein